MKTVYIEGFRKNKNNHYEASINKRWHKIMVCEGCEQITISNLSIYLIDQKRLCGCLHPDNYFRITRGDGKEPIEEFIIQNGGLEHDESYPL